MKRSLTNIKIFYLLIIFNILFISCKQKEAKSNGPSTSISATSTFTKIISSAGTFAANGVSKSTITIFLIDDKQLPLVGVVPAFKATNTSSKNIYGSCSQTNQSGLSTCTLASTKAESKTLEITYPIHFVGGNITFVPGPAAKVAFSTQPSSNVLVGQNITTNPVVEVQDSFGNIIKSATNSISLSAYTNSACNTFPTGIFSVALNPLVLNGISGQAVFSGISYSKWDNLYLKATTAGLTSACSSLIKVRQTVSAANSTIIGTTPKIADNTSTSAITITIKDTLNNPVYGVIPQFQATDTNNKNLYGLCLATNTLGISNCTLKTSKAELKTLSLTYPIQKIGTNILFTSGGSVSANTTISASGPVIANGVASSTISIHFLDAFLNDVSGITPTFSATDTGLTNVIGPCSASATTGISTCTLKSTKPELKTLNITFPSSGNTATVSFTNGPLNNLAITPALSPNAIAGINLPIQPIITAKDISNNLFKTQALPITLAAYSDNLCNTLAGGILTSSSSTSPTNIKNLNTSTGQVIFSAVQYSSSGIIYIGAKNGAVKTCSTAINVAPKPVLTYATSTFNETNANTGSTTNTLSVSLTGDTFMATFPVGGVTFSNVPAGMTANFTKNTATTGKIFLTGSATNHNLANSITNFQAVFNNSAFTSNNALNVTNHAFSNIAVNFIDPYSLSYSLTGFNENTNNSGSISEIMTIDLTGTTFTGVINDNFIGTKLAITNLPTGLLAQSTLLSSTQLQVTFTGAAANHTSANNLSNLTFTFLNSAFTSNAALGVSGSSKTNLTVTFLDPPLLTYNTTIFSESLSNDGSLSNSLVVTLSGDTFANNVASLITMTGSLPAGLFINYVRTSSTVVTISISGNHSVPHGNSADLAGLGFNFPNGSFISTPISSNVTNYNMAGISLDYRPNPILNYSVTQISESSANDGTITQKFTITLSGDQFSLSMLPTDITYTNTPTGMSASFTRDSNTQVSVSLSGNATSHLAVNSISNFQIHFQNSAFKNTTFASNVTNANKVGLLITFFDSPTLSYSGLVLNESIANDGSISNYITITLANDIFSNPLTAATSSGIPGGMTGIFTRVSDTIVRFSLSGNALAHEAFNNISSPNLAITFSDSSFVNSVAANVTNSINTSSSVTFINQAKLLATGSTFNETSNNDGSIIATNSIIFNLTGDSFAISLAGQITVTNLPTGLSANFTRNSSTQVVMTLSGNAISHTNADDVGNVTVTFQDNAFVGNSLASNVANYSKNNIFVNFDDPLTLSYDTTTFSEGLTTTYDINTLAVYHMDGTVGVNSTFIDSLVSSSTVDLTSSVGASDFSSIKKFGSTAFHTTNSYLSTAIDPKFNFSSTPFLIEGWVNLNTGYIATIPASGVGLFALSSGAANDKVQITLLSNGTLEITTEVGGVKTVAGSSAAVITENTWHHIAINRIWNWVSLNTWRLYLDGAVLTSNDLAVINLAASNHQLLVGVDAWNPASRVQGYFDEIRVSNTNRYVAPFTPLTTSFGTQGYLGQITNKITITLSNGTFSGVNNEDFNNNLKVTVIGVPSGLTAKVIRLSNTQVSFELSGTATNHTAIVDNISNLQLRFENSAFSGGVNSTNVINYLKSNLSVNFL